MASGLLDRVDYAQLADNAAVLERVYPLGEMPRLQSVLADAHGSVHARFAFANVESGRAGATVIVEAMPQLICQRCLQGVAFVAHGNSEIEFSSDADAVATDPQREVYSTQNGQVSLRDLAEEELLLALPIVAMHTAQTCAHAPLDEAVDKIEQMPVERTRPFSALQDLLKKT